MNISVIPVDRNLVQNFDQIPCPILVTDWAGKILSVNQSLLSLTEQDPESLIDKSMDVLLPMASRIFLQTHVIPMILREGQIREIRLQLISSTGTRTPVYVNCQKTSSIDVESLTWIFYVTVERTRFEHDLLQARQKADEMSVESINRERFIRTIADGLPSMIAYWDKNLICKFANSVYLRWFGFTPSEILGMSIKDLLGEQLFSLNFPYMQRALAGEPQEFEREIKRPDGSIGYTLANYIPDRDSSGEIMGFFALVTNITKVREADAAIRLSASVFEATSEGIMVTDPQSIILSVNQAFTRLTGYTQEEAVGRNANLLSSSRHSPEFFNNLYKELNLSGKWKGDVWSKRKDDTVFLEKLSISAVKNDAGEITTYVGVFDDITVQWDKEQLVHHMAFHDSLTGLPNRLLLVERLGQLITMAEREKRQIALLFLDLDGFKLVNDILGHDMGDHVLKTIATRLEGQLRGSDTVARLGGDEFVILLDNPDSRESISIIASRLIAVVNEPILNLGKDARVGTSIGIALFQNEGQTPDQLLKLADDAMYKAKKSGKNIFVFSDSN
ncbi:sensor domain-containing protein [Undibacterium umbellatum]|uniref:Diguanylate cyclase n=1 Tax=Undibacterium umbellatum TaxID=2762300 RepID=A0ABR6Z4T7_9BURK|nr:diguanylate cyclase [Undibacterium umbellatum]MBC3906762.1 diguanylate cyclase [Undibacterium umbellatum]